MQKPVALICYWLFVCLSKRKKMKSKIEYVEIDKIHVNKNNPRIIKDLKFQSLCNSLQRFPKMYEIRPTVIDETGMILGGEKRYLAAKQLGWKKVPIIKVNELSEEEKSKFILLDNTHSGEWDFAVQC